MNKKFIVLEGQNYHDKLALVGDRAEWGEFLVATKFSVVCFVDKNKPSVNYVSAEALAWILSKMQETK